MILGPIGRLGLRRGLHDLIILPRLGAQRRRRWCLEADALAAGRMRQLDTPCMQVVATVSWQRRAGQ